MTAAAEDEFAEQARANQEAVQRAKAIEVERQVDGLEQAVDRLWQTIGRVDCDTYRRLDSLRRDLRWLKRKHGPAEAKGAPGHDGTAA